MAMKSIILITALVVLAATQAQAQGILSPFLPPIPGVGIVRTLNVSGILSCSVNVTVNATNPPPPFANATVQLVCGGIVVASNTTNASGAFNMVVNQAIVSLTNILSSCILRVPTPLSTCNATLPSSGTLQAPLVFLRNIAGGIVDILSGIFTLT
ncbi:putative phylloplanin [Helianthus annuus]|nr:putative phylloplanin [Helianthus annuus]KAJ0718153.1 putative phylloplanin [Helianthus annuus]KAJ0763795.1 putative phylloplanin [Helianthus annuus]